MSSFWKVKGKLAGRTPLKRCVTNIKGIPASSSTISVPLDWLKLNSYGFQEFLILKFKIKEGNIKRKLTLLLVCTDLLFPPRPLLFLIVSLAVVLSSRNALVGLKSVTQLVTMKIKECLWLTRGFNCFENKSWYYLSLSSLKKQTKLIKQKQNDTLRAEATFSRFELACEK